MKASTQKKVNGWVEKWKPRLLLSDWSISVEFNLVPKASDKKGDFRSLADISVHEMYTDACITVYPAFESQKVRAQQECIIHEMIHIKTFAIRKVLELSARKGIISDTRSEQLSEGITEYFAKALFKAHTRNQKPKGFHL